MALGIRMESTCGFLLKELQHIWGEIGESEADKEGILSEIEKECLKIYEGKVDEARKTKAQLYKSVAAHEAEVAALVASLGESRFYYQQDENKAESLKEQLAAITPFLENLRTKKEQKLKQFADLKSQIEKISAELTEYEDQTETATCSVKIDDLDLSTRKLNEFYAQLRALQKEKSDRLNKVLEHINEVHKLCGILGLDFTKTVDEIHPNLHKTAPGQFTSISNSTLEGLAQSVLKLKEVKENRIKKLRKTMKSLFELWTLMDSSKEEREPFAILACVLDSPGKDFMHSGLLSAETIEQTEAEADRLSKLKTSRMKELVLKRRLELEEICKREHVEPDASTSSDKISALIDSGLLDPSGLLENIEAQIQMVNEVSMSRKEIMDRIDKWLAACDEENWLEQYNQDTTRYSSGRGTHINLKRAEKARNAVSKIPAMVDNLISRTFAWEDERNMPFLYDGVSLISVLEEYKLIRQQKEEEKKRYRDHRKLQSLLGMDRETTFGSKVTPKRVNSFNKKPSGYHGNGSANGFMTPAPRRLSSGSAKPELLTPRSYSCRYYVDSRRLSSGSLNFGAVTKEDSLSTFTSINGSEPESPQLI